MNQIVALQMRYILKAMRIGQGEPGRELIDQALVLARVDLQQPQRRARLGEVLWGGDHDQQLTDN